MSLHTSVAVASASASSAASAAYIQIHIHIHTHTHTHTNTHTHTTSVHIARSCYSAFIIQEPSISTINATVRSIKATPHIAIYALYNETYSLAHLNTTIQTAAETYLSSISLPNYLIQFQI